MMFCLKTIIFLDTFFFRKQWTRKSSIIWGLLISGTTRAAFLPVKQEILELAFALTLCSICSWPTIFSMTWFDNWNSLLCFHCASTSQLLLSIFSYIFSSSTLMLRPYNIWTWHFLNVSLIFIIYLVSIIHQFPQ